MRQVILRLEAIQERAKSGVSEKCAVDGCGNVKKTLEARTCSECARVYPGIAKRADRAVEDYKKTAFVYESKQNFQAMENGDQKLGPQAWKALQEEIKAAVAGQEVPDELIVRALERKHPNFSKILCQKAVGNFRKWQRFLAKVVELYDIDLWLGDDEQKAILVDQIRDCIDGTEFDHFSREVITQACYEIFPMVKNEIIRRSEELAQEVTVADCYSCHDLKGSAYEKACDISNREGRIEGYAFRKLLKAVAERMTVLRAENQKQETARWKVEQARQKLEDLEAKQATVKAGYEKSAAVRQEEKRKMDEAKAGKAEKEARRREILGGERIPIWRESDGTRFPDAYPVECVEEASLLPEPGKRVLVMLEGKVLSIAKAKNGGKVSFYDITSELVFSEPVAKAAEIAQNLFVNLSNLNKVWVVCRTVSSEAEKAFSLTLEQLADDRILAVISEKELVAEADGNTLYEKQGGQLIEVGKYRQANGQEKKVAKQAAKKMRRKKEVKQQPSDFARVIQPVPEVACQAAA